MIAGLPEDFDDVIADFAAEYSPSLTYAVGDYVTYGGFMWRCKTAIDTAEAWDETKWQKVSAGGQIKQLDGAVKMHGRMLALEDPVTLPWGITDAGYFVRSTDG